MEVLHLASALMEHFHDGSTTPLCLWKVNPEEKKYVFVTLLTWDNVIMF